MTRRRIYVIILFVAASVTAFAQKIHVKASNEPLSSVVKRLNAEVSFDNKVLSQYLVTLDKSFSSPDKAIDYLIGGKPLQMKKVAGVYIISPKDMPSSKPRAKVEYKYVIKKMPDTLSMNLSMSLKEIVITAKNRTPNMKGEENDGTSRFTSITAGAMPGYSDNSVFNVLRMMPGIRASGEPSDELYVWGSSPGESRVSLDGIPLFSMQSYNSNISYINPYMSDEVRYKRGILSAVDGSQTGAKVDVLSGMTRVDKPVFKVMASTMSANLFAAVPIGSRWMVSAAYRHTLESIFGGTTFDAYRNRDDSLNHGHDRNPAANSGSMVVPPTTTTGSTISKVSTEGQGQSTTTDEAVKPYSMTTTITPEYKFQDINLNVTGFGAGNTAYKFTLYGAKDYLDYDQNDSITSNGDQTSYQGGVSGSVKKTWDNSHKTEFSSFFSGLSTKQNGDFMNDNSMYQFVIRQKVSQFNVKLQHRGFWHLKGLTLGSELTTYRVRYNTEIQTAVQPTVFADEEFQIGNLYLNGGLRTDLMSSGVKWQPRALVKYHFLKNFTATASWGIYDQYLVKDPFAVLDNSYQFRWDINSALKSYNTVAGISFDRGGLNVSVEGYLKNIRNSVWVINNVLGRYDFNLKGVDVSAKYNWRHGLFFTSWSYSDDPRQTDGHANEVKAGGIMRFYPFTFSLNYVYGTGYNSMLLPTSSFNDPNKTEKNDVGANTGTNYSRMDLYASYEHRFRYFGVSVGASLINVFDTENKKYTTSWIPRGQSSTFYTEAARFTPIIFFEIKF